MGILAGLLVALVMVAGSLVMKVAALNGRDDRNRVLSLQANLPYTSADSRGGCDRRGNDVYACAASEIILRKPAEALWAGSSEAARLSCMRGVSPTYGPVTQVHACLASRAG